MGKIKLIAFDLDGTLSQHRSHMPEQNRLTLDKLAEKYALVMAGAGMCHRIFNQMEQYPIDIIGNYGMQVAKYDPEKKKLEIVKNAVLACDKKSVEDRVNALRKKYGFTAFAGDSVEFHASGCVTFPILGTKAEIEKKLAFDPDRSKRRAIYEDVKNTFPDYTVFVGGSSSFDMAPHPYNKYYALDMYCAEHGYSHDEVVYVGDDYGLGGNDEAVYRSDFRFVPIDDYMTFPQAMEEFL